MPLFARNVDLGPAIRLSSRRKVAIGTWDGPGDPSVYGISDYDAERAQAYIEKIRAATGQKITLSHFVGKAFATMFERHPQLNCVLRFGRIYPRKSIDVAFLVASDDTGRDLSAMVIRNANKKSIAEIAAEMQATVDIIRKKNDPDFAKMKKTMAGIPGFLARTVLRFSEMLMYVWNIWTPLLGTPRDPFGSVIITNIGSLGLDTAFAPLVPYSRTPLLIVLGSVREQPAVRDGQVVPRPMLRICVTFDHRIIDGVHTSHMARTMEKIFADPEKELGPISS